MAFTELSVSAYALLAALVLLNFIFVDLSVTSTWGEISLGQCHPPISPTNASTISLYLQPAYGYCSVANGLQVVPKSECVLWTNTDYWKQWDSVTVSQGSATQAVDRTMPGVYAVLIVICVISSLNVVTCLVPFVRPSIVSQRAAQMATTGIQFVVFVMLLAALSAETTTPLTDPKNWQAWYQNSQFASTFNVHKSEQCSTGTYSAYIGTLWASFALVISLALSLFAALPERLGCGACVGMGGSAVDSSLTDALTKDGVRSDAIPPNMSVNSRDRISSADTFTSPIV